MEGVGVFGWAYGRLTCLVEEKGAAEKLAPALEPSHFAARVSLKVDWKSVKTLLCGYARDLCSCQERKADAQPAHGDGIALAVGRQEH